MTAPPGATPGILPGGTTTGRQALTGSQMELMLRAAHHALAAADVVIGPSKVARIVRRFGVAVSRRGQTFHEFLTNEANLTPSQQRRVFANPDLARCIAYLDPTGETAVNNVMRGH